jgi:hypothetical protein
MSTKCKMPDCTYLAVSGEDLCLKHRPKPVSLNPSVEADGYTFVSVAEIPSNARYNEASGKLLAAVKGMQPGKALKLSMGKIKKITLLTAQRYALAGGGCGSASGSWAKPATCGS